MLASEPDFSWGTRSERPLLDECAAVCVCSRFKVPRSIEGWSVSTGADLSMQPRDTPVTGGRRPAGRMWDGRGPMNVGLGGASNVGLDGASNRQREKGG